MTRLRSSRGCAAAESVPHNSGEYRPHSFSNNVTPISSVDEALNENWPCADCVVYSEETRQGVRQTETGRRLSLHFTNMEESRLCLRTDTPTAPYDYTCLPCTTERYLSRLRTGVAWNVDLITHRNLMTLDR